MKIAFALIAHYPTDERVYFQLAETLKQAGHEVFIISTLTNDCNLPGTQCFDSTGLPKNLVIRKLQDCLSNCNPDRIVCDNPIAIVAARKYKKFHKSTSIIYDVTEWYPSKKNLREIPFFKKIIKACVLPCLSLYAGWLTDAFIFGEYYKAKPFRFLFFRKKHIYLSYYASIDWIKTYSPKNIREECRFFYSGPLTIEKGFDKVLDVSIQTAKNHPATKFTLSIITGTNDYPISPDLPQNLLIQKKGLLPFPDFCNEIGNSDLFFDLRVNDFENTRCLPIKLFYYMSSGRPMIYTRLKAIRREVPEMEQMGYMVNPSDVNQICEYISNYISDDELYKKHCETAGKSSLEKYNWENIKSRFIQLITEL